MILDDFDFMALYDRLNEGRTSVHLDPTLKPYIEELANCDLIKIVGAEIINHGLRYEGGQCTYWLTYEKCRK